MPRWSSAPRPCWPRPTARTSPPTGWRSASAERVQAADPLRRGPGTAVAIALLGAALATAGCGLGPGEGVGQVALTVTRDYGAEPVLPPTNDKASESDSVRAVLGRGPD